MPWGRLRLNVDMEQYIHKDLTYAIFRQVRFAS